MMQIKTIVNSYVTARVPLIRDEIQELMASLTNNDNYLEFIKLISEHPFSSELDLSMYINEIASPKYPKLKPIIIKKLKVYKDKDAIEDLQEAFLKVTNSLN